MYYEIMMTLQIIQTQHLQYWASDYKIIIGSSVWGSFTKAGAPSGSSQTSNEPE